MVKEDGIQARIEKQNKKAQESGTANQDEEHIQGMGTSIGKMKSLTAHPPIVVLLVDYTYWYSVELYCTASSTVAVWSQCV